MRRMQSSLVSKLRSFLQDQKGTMSIEAALWMPIFFFVLMITVDATAAINAKSQALRIIQDANRAYAIGRLTTVTATQDFIRTRLSDISPHATITTTVANGVVSSAVVMPATDLSGLGALPNFANIRIQVNAQQMVES